MSITTHKRITWILFLVVLGLDQVTKYIAMTQLSLGESIPVIQGLFDFTLVYNSGAAFGMFSDLPDTTRRISLALVSIIALCVVVYFMLREAKDDIPSQYALVAILSGAIGNIIDRVRFDSVVDFLDFYWGTYHWPAFNVADSAICIGVAVLIYRMCFYTCENKPVKEENSELSV